ncbi:gpW family head-tail joining protein [Thalassospira sp. MCCC 1A01428]|jgi:hypothetical protein|uniref:gpW family head-tail joining protein n=1 Tax=unclassified Thalassospira TaxID=2648997 RepID=UPI000A1DCACF|nr:hypothetical protein [Thalassospira sp. MCCC 1A01428]OSQ39212.1 hypothetical protein THS27_21170 [Thalassospira sp. MCCC 1A01428]|tara:strand:+ start:47 stop:262 length:216 start_codon:yes stop_codon:yes gene_type:complete
MIDRPALEAEKARLIEARTRVLCGESVQSVGSNGRNVSYSAANLTNINARLAEIDQLLGLGGRHAIGVRVH